MNTQVFKDNFRVSRRAVHCFHFANVVPALAWEVDDEGGVCSSRTFRNIHFGARNQDCKLCAARAGDKPLVTIDDPLVTIFDSVCTNQCWVRTCNFWFCHREARR